MDDPTNDAIDATQGVMVPIGDRCTDGWSLRTCVVTVLTVVSLLGSIVIKDMWWLFAGLCFYVLFDYAVDYYNKDRAAIREDRARGLIA